MARGFSKAIISDNITRDPELRTTPSGVKVTSFSVAVNRNYKDASGNPQESVSFIDCSAWGKAAEVIEQYAKKGTGILVCGRLDQRSWEDKNTGQKRSRVEIVVEDFNFLSGNSGASDGGSRNSGSNSGSNAGDGVDEVVPDDIADDGGEVALDEIPF